MLAGCPKRRSRGGESFRRLRKSGKSENASTRRYEKRAEKNSSRSHALGEVLRRKGIGRRGAVFAFGEHGMR